MGEVEELHKPLCRLGLLWLLIAGRGLVDEGENLDLVVLLIHVQGAYCKCNFSFTAILERDRIDHVFELVLVDALFALLVQRLLLLLPLHREILLLIRLHLLLLQLLE